MSMRGGVIAVISMAVIITVINTAITGTDTGSELVQDIGPLVVGAAVLMAFMFRGAFSGRG